MAITQDIVATYRGPGKVLRRLLDRGQREDRALAILMAGCLVVFVSQWPVLARRAHLEQTELNPLLGGSLLAWLFIAPLVLYALAALSHMVARALGGQGSHYGARLALFWALLAASPLMLLNGLVGGFIGPGPALSLVGFIWVVLFLWFWFAGLREAERVPQ
ncbi:YIP1 family protein [Primorskyibacter aestuariivivens]|uniref:YIP1 family protein n=1 Tax=Primorskyibacter aestuariivivens TaxID=1888912 RepID=UPI00230052E4|nr:YIP1 family protein [Primorskyibacter aestuariivivens]MDA7428837.1 YIP1 family protein [Primorskyibacter aestuariivivens]